MQKSFKALICTLAVLALLASLSMPAFATAKPEKQEIKFSVYCETLEDIEAAINAGASFVSISEKIEIAQAAKAVADKSALIIDAQSIEEANEKYTQVMAVSGDCPVYYRIKASAGKAIKWAQSKGTKPQLIGFYTGNIYFSALSSINKFGKYASDNTVQLQTGNQDGVILHNTVTSFFAKNGVHGMFSFINTEKAANRTDSARSWDDLIARGYEIIETAYPEDFAEYLSQNTAEREKLQASIDAALAADLKSGYPNRINTYNKALDAAMALLEDGSCATYEMADTRAKLDEAVNNLTIDDGKKVKGDFEITPGRVAAALFGIALVLSWQIYFRKHWGKKEA